MSPDSIWCGARSHGRLSSDSLSHDSLSFVIFTDLIDNEFFFPILTSCMRSILEQLLLLTHPDLELAGQEIVLDSI